MFMITGPGSPSVLSNMPVSIEQHIDFIADFIAWMRERAVETAEADPQAEESWVAHVNEVADTTLFVLANSWYLGANIPGKPRVFMPYPGGVGTYRQKVQPNRPPKLPRLHPHPSDDVDRAGSLAIYFTAAHRLLIRNCQLPADTRPRTLHVVAERLVNRANTTTTNLYVHALPTPQRTPAQDPNTYPSGPGHDPWMTWVPADFH